MTLSVTCAACQSAYRIDNKYAGKSVRCKKCNGKIQIPSGSASAGIDFSDFMIDWDQIESSKRAVPPSLPRKRKAVATPASRDNSLFNTYRMVRIALGLGIATMCVILFVVILRMPWNYEDSRGHTVLNRRKSWLLLLPLIVTGVCRTLVFKPTNRQERDAVFLGTVPLVMRIGVPIVSGGFLLAWLVFRDTILWPTAMIMGLFGLAAMGKGMYRMMINSRDGENFDQIGIDEFLIGFLSAVVSVPHWYFYWLKNYSL